MRKEELTAEAISVEKPCSESWDEMSGNEKTRACSHCSENVNDISMMTETEAFDLIEKSNGNLCVRYESHPVTNAPIFADKFYQITRQTGVTAGVLGATLAVSTSAYAEDSSNVNYLVTPQTTVEKVTDTSNKSIVKAPQVSPTPPKRPPKIMGKIAIRYRITKPLMQAVSQGKSLKVRMMIAKGVDINEKDYRYHSRTALHVAVERNNLKMVNMLLNSGADFNAKDRRKETPLMLINGATTSKIVQTFVQHGANLNHKNSIGRTALMNAVIYRNVESATALIEAGADVNIKDNYGKTALGFARAEPIKQLLIAYGAE